jgi:hypothetical protein
MKDCGNSSYKKLKHCDILENGNHYRSHRRKSKMVWADEVPKPLVAEKEVTKLDPPGNRWPEMA